MALVYCQGAMEIIRQSAKPTTKNFVPIFECLNKFLYLPPKKGGGGAKIKYIVFIKSTILLFSCTKLIFSYYALNSTEQNVFF